MTDWWSPSLRPLTDVGTDESVILTGPAPGGHKSPQDATGRPGATDVAL